MTTRARVGSAVYFARTDTNYSGVLLALSPEEAYSCGDVYTTEYFDVVVHMLERQMVAPRSEKYRPFPKSRVIRYTSLWPTISIHLRSTYPARQCRSGQAYRVSELRFLRLASLALFDMYRYLLNA